MTDRVDVLILGSGFAGTLLGILLAKSGHSVAIVDTATHPRFAIGESSTPIAGRTLARIATEYRIPELAPLARYGSWKQSYPDIQRGMKRGFSYFGHRAGEDFRANEQMLVAASRNSEFSDTHWLRSDVDAFFFELAQKHGVTCFENARYEFTFDGNAWCAEGTSGDKRLDVSAPFVVDGTGANGRVLNYLRIPSLADELQTKSSAVFAHFEGVRTTESLLPDEAVNRHPFPCDAAAVHHVLENGWMWQLRFDDDSVSAGLVGGNEQRLPEWHKLLADYPFLNAQFADAKIIRPSSGLQSTGRLQRLAAAGAGSNWAALPNTVGFVDPLHSTGIAHSLLGVERLATILQHPHSEREQLDRYSHKVIAEIRVIDQLVAGCYDALPDFRLWCDWCMLYFAAITSMENANRESSASFMHADDREFVEVVRMLRGELRAVAADPTELAIDHFESRLREAIRPWNAVGLMERDSRMYTNTAAPEVRN